jgi:WD40 repeat protein
MSTITRLGLLLLVLVCGLLPFGGRGAGADQPSAEEIKKLIEQLGDDDFETRETASKKLFQISEPALAALRKAAEKHNDPEIKARSAQLVARIEKELSGEILTFGSGAGYWLNRVAFTPDGKQAVVTGGAVILYDLETGKELHRTLELSFARCGLALTRDGKQFVTGHQHDKVVRLGEVQTGKVVQTFEGHTAGVYGIALSPDDKYVLSGSNDKTLRLWDAKTGKEVRQFEGVTDMIGSAAYSPDGKRVAAGPHGDHNSGSVRVWDAATGKQVREFKGHSGAVPAVMFTPDNRFLVSASMDAKVIVWDLETGKEVRRWTHPGGVYGAAMSPDGKRVLTAGFGDATVRLWEVATGREIRRYEGHEPAALGVAFSADGKRALATTSRCMVHYWKLPE